MYFPSVRKQIREQCGHIDDGLYFVSKVSVDKSVIVGISNGKLVTKEFWNTDIAQVVEFLNNYIKIRFWDTGHYFKIHGFQGVFRASSEKTAKDWCNQNNHQYFKEVVFSKNFIRTYF